MSQESNRYRRGRWMAAALACAGIAKREVSASEGYGASATRLDLSRGHLVSDYDHIFFSCLSALVAFAAFLGFAQTFYLSSFLRLPAWKAFAAPPHPLAVEVHGVLMTSWVLLVVAQTSLVAAGRTDLHRRLGRLGGFLAFCVVVGGTAVVSQSLARRMPPGAAGLGAQADQVLRILAFGALVYFAYRRRRDPPAHKRLMMIATVALLPAAVVRWPIMTSHDFPLALGVCYALLMLIVGYDLLTARKIYPATLWGSAIMIVAYPPFDVVFTRNPAWFAVARSMQSVGALLR